MGERRAGSLEARLERIELENRRWRQVALLAAVAVAAVVVLAAAASKSPPKVVKTSELQVVDGQGVARIRMQTGTNGDPKVTMTGVGGDTIELGFTESRPVVSLHGKNRGKAVLEVRDEGTVLAVEGAGGTRTARLSAEDPPGVFIDAGSGKRLASLSLDKRRGPSVTLVSPEEPGSPAIALQVASPFGPILAVTQGLASASLNVSEKEEPSVTITDGQGRDRAVLGVTSLVAQRRRKGAPAERVETGPSSLVLFAADQTVLWKAP